MDRKRDLRGLDLLTAYLGNLKGTSLAAFSSPGPLPHLLVNCMPQPDTFHEHWSRAVVAHADSPFLLFHDQSGTNRYTYSEFDDAVASTAGVLAARGVARGSSVHVVLRNCPGFLAVWLAVARLGAWMVPTDPASSPRDIGNQIRRTEPIVGICAHSRAQDYRDGAADTVPVLIELAETASDLEPGGPLHSEYPITECVTGIRGSDQLAVMFTSGTTSEPKGVVLTQKNYATVAQTMAAAVDLRSKHRWLVTLPLFHANAQYYCIAPAIATGASVALTHTFSASRWADQAHELQVTHASLFAAPIRMILARCGNDAPGLELEHVWFAQSLGRVHHEQFARLVGCRPRQLYGMTETVAAVTGDTSDPLRHDVIGHPLGGRLVSVVDPDTGQAMPAETPGMLLVYGTRGQDLFSGYLNDPETTGASFLDQAEGTSWFRTGDLVRVDRDTGAMRFVGRADDVIKVSGENVSLTEVESVLAQAPGVLEVAIVARPDPIRDQVPVAYIVPHDAADPPDITELSEWAARNLPPAARPRSWHIIDELPRTSVGKVRRFQMTQRPPS